MVPFRFDYAFLVALVGLTVAWHVQRLEPWWIWLVFWLTLGAFLAYRAVQQLRLDLRFASGGKRAGRDYPLDVRGETAGTLPVSGTGPGMVYFTARVKGEHFRLVINPPVIRMWAEDEAERTVPEVGLGAVGAVPAFVREREHYYYGKHKRRRGPGPGGELYVPNAGPWRFNIRFTIRTKGDSSVRLVLQVRVWGKCRDVRVPDAPEVHAMAPPAAAADAAAAAAGVAPPA